ncbi:transmembrane emp24 domain-containing protein 7 isoform X2 [Folsomia candida]|uniref:transmembrane emp24 domain-containing protein 7 isoform X2 n=1 Tax=Folsomia candida TaxID=158441 RepID=UPI0016054AC2|nr:transmembrane emp24 domain-containing protein 7 isoform X2 [Folsomia candida]
MMYLVAWLSITFVILMISVKTKSSQSEYCSELCPNSVAFTVTILAWREECFYEFLTPSDLPVTFSYLVITGGRLDVNVAVAAPGGELIYMEYLARQDTYDLPVDTSGIYKFCFSNKFSWITEKLVYFGLKFTQNDDILKPDWYDKPTRLEENQGNLTQLEVSLKQIHINLGDTQDKCDHAKMTRTSEEVAQQEDVVTFKQIQITSILLILVIMLGQVILVKKYVTLQLAGYVAAEGKSLLREDKRDWKYFPETFKSRNLKFEFDQRNSAKVKKPNVSI